MKTLEIDHVTYKVIGYWTDGRTGDQNMQLVSPVNSVRQHRIRKEKDDEGSG